MNRVLFVCFHNAGRSQLAQALYERRGGEARSAGTQPAKQIHPPVLEALAEVGIELGDRRPRLLSDEDLRWADLVVTMGCGDACPVSPGKRYLDWELPDPQGRSLEEVRLLRDEIARRVDQFEL